MRSLTTSALAAAALILTTLPAVAGNWYGLISAGLVHSDNNYKEAVGAVNNANNQNPVNDADNSNVTAKLAVGCRVNDHFAVEAAAWWFGKSEHDHAGIQAGQRVSSHAEFKGYGLAVDAVGILPVTDALSVFGKAGVALIRIDGQNNASEPQYSFSKSKTRLAPKLGAGAEWLMTERLSLRLEYEHFFNAGKESRDGQTFVMPDVDYDTVTVGLKMNF